MTIATPEEAQSRADELAGLKSLLRNRAWTEIVLPKIREMERAAFEGNRARNKTPAERAEYVEASHNLEELAGLVEARIAVLEKELGRYSQEAETLSVRFVDTMGE